MLDAFIIDAIRREELERERAFDRNRPRLELPIPRAPEPRGYGDAGRSPRWSDPGAEYGESIVIPIGGPPDDRDEAA